MKRIIILITLCLCNVFFVFGQEEYLYIFSGTVSGLVNVKKGTDGKITITPSIHEWGEVMEITISSVLSPILPQSYIVRQNTQTIIIDGNTTVESNSDRSWKRTIKNGNETMETNSDGSWVKTVVDGNETLVTKSDGSWIRTFISGNRIMTTFSNGTWERTVVSGNTTIFSWESKHHGIFESEYVVDGNKITAKGYAYQTGSTRTVNGNVITIVSTFNNELLLRVEKQGNNIFITTGKISFVLYDDDNKWVDVNNFGL